MLYMLKYNHSTAGYIGTCRYIVSLLLYTTKISLMVYKVSKKYTSVNLCAHSFFWPGSFVYAFLIWALEVSFHTSYSPPQGWNSAF